jgi:hypothetical protein
MPLQPAHETLGAAVRRAGATPALMADWAGVSIMVALGWLRGELKPKRAAIETLGKLFDLPPRWHEGDRLAIEGAGEMVRIDLAATVTADQAARITAILAESEPPPASH